VLLYLCARQPTPALAEQRGATLGLISRLEERMRTTLLAAEFLNPQAPQHVLGELTRSLVRHELTEREAQLWLAAFDHLARHVTPSSASR
jgi:tRNA/rRNA methyltransferase